MSKKAGKKEGGSKVTLPKEDEHGYSNFSEPDETTNVILNFAGNKKLYAHKDVLLVKCESSDLHDRLLQDASSKDPLELTLQDDSYEAWLEVCKCLYPPHKPINQDNLDIVLPVVGKYKIALKEKCEEQLLEKKEFELKHLKQAEELGSDMACDKIAEYLIKENTMSDLEKQQELEELNDSTKAKLYRARILYLQDERTRLDMAAANLYGLTKPVIPAHGRCLSVDTKRFGYLCITTIDDSGKKRREQHHECALINLNEINRKCKDCLINYGKECHRQLCELDKNGAFNHLKKKFESEKKAGGKSKAGAKK